MGGHWLTSVTQPTYATHFSAMEKDPLQLDFYVDKLYCTEEIDTNFAESRKQDLIKEIKTFLDKNNFSDRKRISFLQNLRYGVEDEEMARNGKIDNNFLAEKREMLEEMIREEVANIRASRAAKKQAQGLKLDEVA